MEPVEFDFKDGKLDSKEVIKELKSLLLSSKLNIFNPDSMSLSFETKSGIDGTIDITGSPTSDDVCEVLFEGIQTNDIEQKFMALGEHIGYMDLAKEIAFSITKHVYDKYEVVIDYENEFGGIEQEHTGVIYYEKNDRDWCEQVVKDNLDDYIDTEQYSLTAIYSEKQIITPLTKGEKEQINKSLQKLKTSDSTYRHEDISTHDQNNTPEAFNFSDIQTERLNKIGDLLDKQEYVAIFQDGKIVSTDSDEEYINLQEQAGVQYIFASSDFNDYMAIKDEIAFRNSNSNEQKAKEVYEDTKKDTETQDTSLIEEANKHQKQLLPSQVSLDPVQTQDNTQKQ